MRSITLRYVVRRFGIFVLTVWIAATIIFIIPRLAPGDPITAMVARLSSQSGYVEGADQMIAAWRERFGLDDPLLVQYVRYLQTLVTFDFGYSLANFPTPVNDMIMRALPWTIGLLTITLAITFVIGNLLGALLAWRSTPWLVKALIPVSMMFTSIPPLLASILLLYLFAIVLDWLPLQGSYGRGMQPELTWEYVQSVALHSILPALSIVLVTFGYWALGMRGMMVTIEGEDYMTLARAKGLTPRHVLYRYSIRNAILPQVTALALSVGTIVGGQILVEVVFQYRGMGTLIFTAIRNQDYTTIQGTSYMIILTTAMAVLILDLIYPLIDPRISYERKK